MLSCWPITQSSAKNELLGMTMKLRHSGNGEEEKRKPTKPCIGRSYRRASEGWRSRGTRQKAAAPLSSIVMLKNKIII